jgi:asparagine synthetase B (glutamine-hydrolysing)
MILKITRNDTSTNEKYICQYVTSVLSCSYENDKIFVAFIGKIHHSESEKNNAAFFYKMVEEYPDTISEKIDGYYGVVMLNKLTGDIGVYRDPIGLQPLYYSVQEKIITFTSSFRSLVGLSTNLTPCKEFFLLYLEEAVPNTYELTIYEELKRVKPNTLTLFQNFQLVKQISLFDFENHSSKERTNSMAISEFQDKLEEAINKSIKGHQKLSMQFTGGLDSTGIVAICKYLRGNQNLQTYFNEYFPDHPTFDEMYFVKKLHETDDLPLPQKTLSHQKLSIEEEIQINKERHTLNIINQIFEHILQDVHQKQSKLLLSGFGGDECITYNQNPYFFVNQLISFRLRIFVDSLKTYGIKRFFSYLLKTKLKYDFLKILHPNAFNNNFKYRNKPERKLSNKVYGTKNNIAKMLQKYGVVYRIEEEKELAEQYGITLEYPWLDLNLIKYFLSLKTNQIILKKQGRRFFKEALKKYLTSAWYFDYTKSSSVTVAEPLYKNDNTLNEELRKNYKALPEFIKIYTFEEKATLQSTPIKEILLERFKKINSFF